MTKLEEMREMGYEAFIPASSKQIIGKTFGQIEKEFAIKIDHYHNSPIEVATRKEPREDTIISVGMSIHVIGEWDAIDNFRNKYDLF